MIRSSVKAIIYLLYNQSELQSPTWKIPISAKRKHFIGKNRILKKQSRYQFRAYSPKNLREHFHSFISTLTFPGSLPTPVSRVNIFQLCTNVTIKIPDRILALFSAIEREVLWWKAKVSSEEKSVRVGRRL